MLGPSSRRASRLNDHAARGTPRTALKHYGVAVTLNDVTGEYSFAMFETNVMLG